MPFGGARDSQFRISKDQRAMQGSRGKNREQRNPYTERRWSETKARAPEIPKSRAPRGYPEEGLPDGPEKEAEKQRQRELDVQYAQMMDHYSKLFNPLEQRWQRIRCLEHQKENPITGEPRSDTYFQLLKTREGFSIRAHLSKCLELFESAQVFVLSSGTGSGKSTEMVMALLFNQLARSNETLWPIICTQPRRENAFKLGERVSLLCDVDVGGYIGWQARGELWVQDYTLVRYVTDGLLLAQARWGPADFFRNKIIVVDEAHERNSNIDMLFFELKESLKAGIPVKVIVMSATIKASVFTSYFSDFNPARLEIQDPPKFRREFFYLDEDPRLGELPGLIFDKAALYLCQGKDILVFLDGQDAIEQARQRLEDPYVGIRPMVPHVRVFILLAGLDRQEKDLATKSQRISGQPRIILATNVAETGLTIDELDVVIDTGRVKVADFNPSSGASSLHLKWETPASADQRAGRIGRQSDGICERLFTKKTFEDLQDVPSAFTRMRLTEEVLKAEARGRRLANLDLIDRPSQPYLDHAINELTRLGCMNQGRLTNLGSHVAQLDCSTRLGIMLVHAWSLGRLGTRYGVSLVAALEMQQPRKVMDIHPTKVPLVVKGCEHDQGDLVALAVEVADHLLDYTFEPLFHSKNALLKILSTSARHLDDQLRRLGLDSPRTPLEDPNQIVISMARQGLRHQVAKAGSGKDVYYDQSGLNMKLYRGSLLSVDTFDKIYKAGTRDPAQASREFSHHVPQQNWPYLWYYEKRELLNEQGQGGTIVIDLAVRASDEDGLEAFPGSRPGIMPWGQSRARQ